MTASQRELPIGIFDSGLGGLTVLKELRRQLPNEKFIYLGDTARTPYGTKSKDTIQRYSLECARFLRSHEIKLLVVACNTASSLALDVLAADCPCPVIGTIEPAIDQALAVPECRRIGVIGTKGTIRSGAYQQRLAERFPKGEIFSLACPLFVPLVEEGIYGGEIVEQVTELYLMELRSKELDALILGCTHYPLLAAELQKYMGPKTALVECSKSTAAAVQALLLEHELTATSVSEASSSERYFVTDDVDRFNYLASLFLEHRPVAAVQLEAL